MIWVLTLAISVPLLVSTLRGEAFHNYLVHQSASAFRDAGFDATTECPRRLPDGRLDFIDILATRVSLTVACEVETTTRWIVPNVEKAHALGLPVWIVVPTRALRESTTRKLKKALVPVQCLNTWISLPDQLPRGLAVVFPVFLSANAGSENRKNAFRVFHEVGRSR